MLFVGSARYGRPLNSTVRKKFALLSSEWDIAVIAFSRGLLPRWFTDHARFYLLPNVSVPVLRYVALFGLAPIIGIWLVLTRGVEVVVTQSPYEAFVGAVVKRVARWLGCKVALVVESHGDFEENAFLQRPMRMSGQLRRVMALVARAGCLQADVLRAVSRQTMGQLERLAPGRPRVQFPAWTDIEPFWKAGANRDDSTLSPVVLYAGVVVRGKGIHHLIAAFSRVAPEFPEVCLVILGREGHREYVGALRRQIRGFGLDGRVRFVGEVAQSVLAEWMARARVFVLPTLSEGLPRVVLEAMAVGVPVIASAVSSIPGLIEDGVSGFLVAPGDEEGLSQRVAWVLGYPAEAATVGRRARERAECLFSTEEYVRGYQQVISLAKSCRHEGPGGISAAT